MCILSFQEKERKKESVIQFDGQLIFSGKKKESEGHSILKKRKITIMRYSIINKTFKIKK